MAKLKTNSKRRKRSKSTTASAGSTHRLDEIYHRVNRLSGKLVGVASLFAKAATDESGLLDLDPSMNGVGYVLEDYATELEELASEISEHALTMSKLHPELSN